MKSQVTDTLVLFSKVPFSPFLIYVGVFTTGVSYMYLDIRNSVINAQILEINANEHTVTEVTLVTGQVLYVV